MNIYEVSLAGKINTSYDNVLNILSSELLFVLNIKENILSVLYDVDRKTDYLAVLFNKLAGFIKILVSIRQRGVDMVGVFPIVNINEVDLGVHEGVDGATHPSGVVYRALVLGEVSVLRLRVNEGNLFD